MSDDMKKTVLQPRFANRMAYHTVVMENPPEMAVAAPKCHRGIPHQRRPRPEEPIPSPPSALPGNTPGAPSSPAATRVPDAKKPARISSLGMLRTRMVDAQAMPSFHNQLPPATSCTALPSQISDRLGLRLRIAVLGACVAILLGVSLVLLLAGTTESETANISPEESSFSPKDAAVSNSETASPSADEIRDKMPSRAKGAARVVTSVTEEEAGAMLLAGRQHAALSLYQKLANSPQTTPGIQAMVEVLAQKVATQ